MGFPARVGTLWLFRIVRGNPQYLVFHKQRALPLHIQSNMLEQSPQIINPITAALDHFDLVVQPFHETAGLAPQK